MREGTEVTYKGHVLIALAIPERGTYTSMLITHDPDGERRASGTLGTFSSAIQAQGFALQHGMAEIDRRSFPQSDRPPVDIARHDITRLLTPHE